MRVFDVSARDNVGFGISIEAGNAIIKNSVALGNGASGIRALSSGPASLVGNSVVGKGGHGVFARSAGRTVLKDAVALNNAGSGLHVQNASEAVVRDSMASGNGLHGMFARAADRTVFADNNSHRSDQVGPILAGTPREARNNTRTRSM